MALRDIRVVSFCEHHMLPVVGRAHVGYLPTNKVVGISKLARVVHGFARRLQIQEKLTAEIAEAIQDILKPQGVGVVIEAEHSCMTLRGVNTLGSTLTTNRLLGVIRDGPTRVGSSLLRRGKRRGSSRPKGASFSVVARAKLRGLRSPILHNSATIGLGSMVGCEVSGVDEDEELPRASDKRKFESCQRFSGTRTRRTYQACMQCDQSGILK